MSKLDDPKRMRCVSDARLVRSGWHFEESRRGLIVEHEPRPGCHGYAVIPLRAIRAYLRRLDGESN